MKKSIFSLIALAAAMSVSAQDNNPIDRFPNEKGDILITQCYDADGNLRGTMKYTIAENEMTTADDSSLTIVFDMVDGQNKVIDYGTIYADYADGDFSMRMSNRATVPDIYKFLSINTKMMNDFLDYPDPFYENDFNPGPFEFDGAEYTIKVGPRNRDFVSVEVSDRNWVGNEVVVTPAGAFDASKITFDLSVYDNMTKETHKYKGVEWYSVGAGIVQTNIYDAKDNLLDYTVLTDLQVHDN